MTFERLSRYPAKSRGLIAVAWELDHASIASSSSPKSLTGGLTPSTFAPGYAVVADGRVDNRTELIAALKGNGDGQGVSDLQLILQAYLKWGEHCPNHLLGDFVFAIWDERKQEVFCARDHTGMKQLFYAYVPGKVFAISTDVQGVLAHPDVLQELNHLRLAEYLDDLEYRGLSSTFFKGVKRLPPAHYLRFSKEGLTVERYWSLTPPPQLQLDSDEEYEAAFMNVFREAVKCRLQGLDPVCSMLSGGMDSGSIVSVASELLTDQGAGPLQTYSVIGNDPVDCSETRAVLDSLDLQGINPTVLDPSDLRTDSDTLVDAFRKSDPFDGHMNLHRLIYNRARKDGFNVVLDGAAGDVVLGSGPYTAQLIKSFQWRKAWREALGEEQYWGKDALSRWTILVAASRRAFMPDFLRELRRRFRKGPSSDLVDAEFARGIGYSPHEHVPTDPGADALAARTATMTSGLMVAARERYDRVAAEFGIEVRDPFMDRRVMEFCLSLPPDQLQRNGWPKFILRRAMEGRLPDSVVWRKGKGSLGWMCTTELVKLWPQWRDAIAANADRLKPMLNELGRHLAFEKQGELQYNEEITIASLANWMTYGLSAIDSQASDSAPSGEPAAEQPPSSAKV